MIPKSRVASHILAIAVACPVMPIMAHAATTPAIRTSVTNKVPACATPARLDAFLNNQIRQRGYRLSPRHRDIAKWYRKHGKAYSVRWDYAFFQMALETNFLSFRRSNGKRGDVRPRQNNFAGLGTTGGGVPGDSYPDVSTGVLAQIQHLVVYSGERLPHPVGHRTRLKQGVILESVRKLAQRRPIRFADLAGRWAADRRYGRSIRRLADLFYSEYCQGPQQNAQQTKSDQTSPPPKRKSQVAAAAFVKAPRPRLARSSPGRPQRTNNRLARVAMAAAITRSPPKVLKGRAAVPVQRQQRRQAAKTTETLARTCHIQVASYGGTQAVLIESITPDAVNLTALNVQPGFEEMMTQSFIQSHAPSGKALGTFPNRSAAIAKAQSLCRQRTVQLGR